MRLLWVNPSRQLSTTQLLAHSLPPAPVGQGKRKGRVKAIKFVDREKNCLISKGEGKEERKKTKQVMQRANHSPSPMGIQMSNQFLSKRWVTF